MGSDQHLIFNVDPTPFIAPPPTPTLLVDEDGNLIVVVGTEVIGEGDSGNPNLRKRRWMQLPKDEAGEIRLRGVDESEEEEHGDGEGA